MLRLKSWPAVLKSFDPQAVSAAKQAVTRGLDMSPVCGIENLEQAGWGVSDIIR